MTIFAFNYKEGCHTGRPKMATDYLQAVDIKVGAANQDRGKALLHDRVVASSARAGVNSTPHTSAFSAVIHRGNQS